MARVCVGYWGARGLAEPIRTALRHLGVAFEDKVYPLGDAPDYEHQQWEHDKATLPMAYPNLPYLVDGDFYLSESWAILKYVCGKYRPEYLGRDLKERAHAAMLQGVLQDMRMTLGKVAYLPEPDEDKKIAAINATVHHLGTLAQYLTGKNFLLGDGVTYVDFFLYEYLQYLEAWAPGTAASVSDVFAAYCATMHELPNIAAYEAARTLPFNTRRANCLNS